MSNEKDLATIRCKLAEGFRSRAYRDTVGHLTIGYGFNVDAGISEYAASALLEAQLSEGEVDLQEYQWYAGADDVRRSVLLELAFNMGIGGLLGFRTMLQAVDDQNWSAAADALQNSKWFHQVGSRGPVLVRLMREGGLT